MIRQTKLHYFILGRSVGLIGVSPDFMESYFNLLVSLYLVELQLVVKCDWPPIRARLTLALTYSKQTDWKPAAVMKLYFLPPFPI